MAIFGLGRDGKTVSVRIRLARDVNTDYLFQHTFDHPTIASLVEDQIYRLMEERVNFLVSRAYEHGWSDAKKRRPKKRNFTDCLNANELVW